MLQPRTPAWSRGLSHMLGWSRCVSLWHASNVMLLYASYPSKQPTGFVPTPTTSTSCRMRFATIHGRHPSTVPSSCALESCWSWITMPHLSLGALALDHGLMITGFRTAGGTHVAPRQAIFDFIYHHTPINPVRIWCCFEESIAVEERNKGTLGTPMHGIVSKLFCVSFHFFSYFLL